MIVETEVLTHDEEQENLGLPTSHLWLKIAVDFSKVEIVREVCPSGSDDVYQDRCGIWLCSGVLTIKYPYEEALDLWKKAKL